MNRGNVIKFFLTSILVFVPLAAASDSPVAADQGSYAPHAPTGAKRPPSTIYATESVRGKMPTNDWWSSLAWMPLSERQYPHPLAVQAETSGLRIYYPGSNIVATKDAIFGFMPANTGDDIVLGHSRQETFPDARVEEFSDWFVKARFSVADKSMTVSYGHGSPLVFARYANGSPKLTFATVPTIWSGDSQSAVLGLTVGGRHYGLFGPDGTNWIGLGTTNIVANSQHDYFSIAVLPDKQPDTLALFQQYAHNHVTDTKIATRYDQTSGRLTTTYTVATQPMEDSADGTLLALYPHQWKHTKAGLLGLGYNSVRGDMKLLKGTQFETTLDFPGVLPVLPNVGGCSDEQMTELLKREAAAGAVPIKDTYWEGKWLGRTATLIPIAEVYGHPEIAQTLRTRLRERLEQWLTATSEKGETKSAGLFWYDDNWGTLIGQPASYGSDTELNDHHFHYGYFIRAAAEIARTDPQWGQQWGGMIELLIRDIASVDRQDPMFPFLRSFDPCAGHSWASGHAKFGDGNNNESSSEAMNAWYGIILWGQFTNNVSLRDLGIYLYTTEMTSIHEYWFDVDGTNHPETYRPSVVTMVWGGKGANETWFSGNPEVIHGINWLPIHGGSLYLGHFPTYAAKNYLALRQENDRQPWDEWSDLIWMYRALSDPSDAMQQFSDGQRSSPTESGNSLANTYHWIGSLQALGTIQRHVSADTPIFAVFDKGQQRTYVTYRRQHDPPTILFSDGFRMSPDKQGMCTATRILD